VTIAESPTTVLIGNVEPVTENDRRSHAEVARLVSEWPFAKLRFREGSIEFFHKNEDGRTRTWKEPTL